MKSFLAILIVLIAAAFGLNLAAEDPADRRLSDHLPASDEPVLVELFTSQGCSSCPPADRFAARLRNEGNVVVISRPVTYWDRLGWKDTLAREDNTRLQRAYAQRGLAGRNGVYTPQMVVDGEFGAVGSDEHEVRRLIRAARRGDHAAIRARRNDDGSYAVGLGGTTQERAELMLISIASETPVSIGRGENNGRKITYTNVLVHERKLEDWYGGSQSVLLSPQQLSGTKASHQVLVLREPGGGRVLAARRL